MGMLPVPQRCSHSERDPKPCLLIAVHRDGSGTAVFAGGKIKSVSLNQITLERSSPLFFTDDMFDNPNIGHYGDA